MQNISLHFSTQITETQVCHNQFIEKSNRDKSSQKHDAKVV